MEQTKIQFKVDYIYTIVEEDGPHQPQDYTCIRDIVIVTTYCKESDALSADVLGVLPGGALVTEYSNDSWDYDGESLCETYTVKELGHKDNFPEYLL